MHMTERPDPPQPGPTDAELIARSVLEPEPFLIAFRRRGVWRAVRAEVRPDHLHPPAG
jgi:hypothetical protein